MSRHELATLPGAGHVEVVVDWDPPLCTFFAQVWDRSVDEDDPAAELLWIGTGYRQVSDIQAVRLAVAPWAAIPAEVERELYREAHA